MASTFFSSSSPTSPSYNENISNKILASYPSQFSCFRSSKNCSLLNLKLSVSRRSCIHASISTANKIISNAAVVPTIISTKPRILVAEKLGEAGLNLLRSFAEVDCSYDLSPDQLCSKISQCDALIVRSGTKVTRDVFESSKGRLKVVGRAGVGIDNVDLQAATEFGCLVVNAPTANTIAAAEHGIALLTSMARNVAQADASIKSGIYVSFKLFYSYLLLKKTGSRL